MILLLDPNLPRRDELSQALGSLPVLVESIGSWSEASVRLSRGDVKVLLVAADLPSLPLAALCRVAHSLTPPEQRLEQPRVVILYMRALEGPEVGELLAAGADDVWSAQVPLRLMRRRVERMLPPPPRATGELPAAPPVEGASPRNEVLGALSQIGKMTAQISHELRNPASTISHSVDQLPQALTEFLSELPDVISAVRDEEEQRRLLRFYVDVIQEVLRGERPDMRSRRDRTRAFATDLGDGDESWSLAQRLVAGGLDRSVLRERILEVYRSQGAAPLKLAGSLVEFLGGYRNLKVSSERINRLITAVRSFVRVGAPASVVDVHQALSESLDLIRLQVPRGVHIVQDFLGATMWVQAQPSELGQVWTNLLANAAEALKGAGLIRICTRRKDSGGRSFAVVDVEDNGPGIPSEHLPRIFEPFFTTKQEGSGIGLDVCRQIIERHGGTIDVTSYPGKTVFTVCLPEVERS